MTLILAGATWTTFQPEPELVTGTPALDVAALFVTKGCSGCHSRGGGLQPQGVAPDLAGLADRAGGRVEGLSAREYVRQSLLEPQAYVVPGFSIAMPVLTLSDSEIELLVEYLLTSLG